MATIEELEELYKNGQYREVIAAVDVKEIRKFEEEVVVGKFITRTLSIEKRKVLTNELTGNDKKLLKAAWAHHQLGEYDKSIPIVEKLRRRYLPSSEIGESARLCMAHGLLQGKGDIDEAFRLITQISYSPERDNTIMNMFIVAARQGKEIPAPELMEIVTRAILNPPYNKTVGHIFNNGALALYEAREQEGAKKYQESAAILIKLAIEIYELADVPKNHIAGALYRASLIFEAAGRNNEARKFAREAIYLWQELVNAQDGSRYQRNLEGSLRQLGKLETNKVVEGSC